MALIPPDKGGGEAFDLVNASPLPAGSHHATVHRVIDQIGVERKKFQSEETEIVNLCTLVFASTGRDGVERYAATRAMRISSSPKASLFEIIQSLTGEVPQVGGDTQALLGLPAIIKVVSEKGNNGKTYLSVKSAVQPPEAAPAPAPQPRPAAPPKPRPAGTKTVSAPAPNPPPRRAEPPAPAAEDDPQDERDPYA
jgi:hypothetical protein